MHVVDQSIDLRYTRFRASAESWVLTMAEVSRSEDAIIFVNYRRTDAGWCADRLEKELKDTFGEDHVFLDVRDIDAGDDFIGEIQAKLRRATAVIVLIGKNWLQVYDKFGRRRLDDSQDWVRQEIRGALEKQGGVELYPYLSMTRRTNAMRCRRISRHL